MRVTSPPQAATKWACERPMAEWSDLADEMSSAEKIALAHEADAAAERYARFAAYMGRLASGGNHDDAVKEQNRVAKGVRKSLGFSQPDKPITF